MAKAKTGKQPTKRGGTPGGGKGVYGKSATGRSDAAQKRINSKIASGTGTGK